MKDITELRKLFDEIVKLKSKASMTICRFCTELTASDDDDFLELHFSLLEQKKKYIQSDLKLYFTFRTDREKAHNFLKSKLQHIKDEDLLNDVKEIIAEIRYCDLDEYKQWLADLKSGKRSDDMEFVWSITKSPFVEYHYSLWKDKSLDEEFRLDLMHRFEDHKDVGATLLLSKLDNNEDVDLHADILFSLGSFKAEQKRTLEYARKFANAEDDYLRDRAIIVLGWIGSEKDVPLLGERLLNDANAKCRTWSATSFMQMYFRRKSKSLVEKALPYLKQAISQEKNYFALGVMIDVVKELTGKKFGLPQYVIDNANVADNKIDSSDKEKIEAAKAKVERFFKKIK